MPRLRNTRTGSVVNVSDVTAARLGAEYTPLGGRRQEPSAGAPRGNASRDEWAAYADSLGVSFDEDAKRDDIKAAVEAAAESGDDE